MILVISNILNEAATGMVDMFPPGAASLITASAFKDSFKMGISVNDFSSCPITMKNKQIPVKEISGVITTVPYFLSQEFYYIEPEDRDYVCAELNAFFIYFLSTLKCRIINPPSAKSLTGLHQHKYEWVKTVADMKIPLWPVAFKNGIPVRMEGESALQYVKYTMIDNVIIQENVPDRIDSYMRRISAKFALPFLSCVFVSQNGNDHYLLDIVSVPDIDPVENKRAIVNYFQKSA